jgi:hypothetical protein
MEETVDHDSLLALFRRLTLASAPLLMTSCTTTECGPVDIEGTVPLAQLQPDAGSRDDAGRFVGELSLPDGGLDDLCREAFPTEVIETCKLVTIDGEPTIVAVIKRGPGCAGRRPAGLAPAPGTEATGLGVWLAGAAHLEAASVDAFEILAGELTVHGAPSALVDAARAAADDERRHARLMGRLAVAAGSRPPAALVARRPPRDLEAVANENAVEGCVRETYAALVAWRQARAAEAPELRHVMGGIAADETRHAALSWAVDEWARERLSPARRRRVEAARRETIEQLGRELTVAEPTDVRALAGLPEATEAVQLAAALFARVA